MPASACKKKITDEEPNNAEKKDNVNWREHALVSMTVGKEQAGDLFSPS